MVKRAVRRLGMRMLALAHVGVVLLKRVKRVWIETSNSEPNLHTDDDRVSNPSVVKVHEACKLKIPAGM